MTTETAAPNPAAAQLLAEAAAIDATNTPPPIDDAGQPIAPTDYASEAAGLIAVLVGVASPFWPSVGRIWTAPKQAQVSAALAPVLEKHNFTLGDFMGDWKEEITLAMVAGPLVVETVAGIKADRLAPPKKPAETATAPAAAAPMFADTASQ